MYVVCAAGGANYSMVYWFPLGWRGCLRHIELACCSGSFESALFCFNSNKTCINNKAKLKYNIFIRVMEFAFRAISAD